MPKVTIIVSELDLYEQGVFEHLSDQSLYDPEGRYVWLYPETHLLRHNIEEDVEDAFAKGAVVVTDNDLWIISARVLVKEKGYSLEVIEWKPDWTLKVYPIDSDGRWGYPDGSPPLLGMNRNLQGRLL